jgi:Fe2+ transport system protein FeoA
VAAVATVAGDDALAQRLGDLGFWPGTRLVLMRRAPFGGPVECFLHGFRVALRRSEADRVLVQPGEPLP